MRDCLAVGLASGQPCAVGTGIPEQSTKARDTRHLQRNLDWGCVLTKHDRTDARPETPQNFPHGNFGLVTGHFCWALVHQGPDAIIYTDIGGLIRFWNASAERLFGYSAAEVIGRSLGLTIPEICCERCWSTYTGASLESSRYSDGTLISVPARSKIGECMLIEFTTFRHMDIDGTPIGMAIIARDITERIDDRDRTAKQAPVRRS